MTDGVSRMGSVVTKTTCVMSRTDGDSLVIATARSLMTSGQTLGQLGYPKKTSVTGSVVSVIRLNGLPDVSSRVTSGIAYGVGGCTPKNDGTLVSASPSGMAGARSDGDGSAPVHPASTNTTPVTNAGKRRTDQLIAG